MRREPVWALSEQNERWGAVFGTGWGGSTKMSRMMRALKPGARRLGGLVPPRELRAAGETP
jgi:hypothetical protein